MHNNSSDVASHGSGFSYDPETKVCYRTLSFMNLPEYRVGDDGSVWSLKKTNSSRRDSWHRMRPTAVKGGHLRVFIKPRSYFVQRLVLMAFVGLAPAGQQCRHFPDQNPTNNRVENLRWGTVLENQRDRIVNGTVNRGSRHGRAKQTETKVVKIREMYEHLTSSGSTYGAVQRIAETFNMSNGGVQHIIKRRSWKHI